MSKHIPPPCLDTYTWAHTCILACVYVCSHVYVRACMCITNIIINCTFNFIISFCLPSRFFTFSINHHPFTCFLCSRWLMTVRFVKALFSFHVHWKRLWMKCLFVSLYLSYVSSLLAILCIHSLLGFVSAAVSTIVCCGENQTSTLSLLLIA